MNLNQWAIKWGIPFEAIEDLRREFGIIIDNLPLLQSGESEAAIQTRVRLEAAKKGIVLWRNNVGAIHKDGYYYRYGLANDSQQLNKILKSSDLIGIRTILIGHNHIGLTIGQFVAREVKKGEWQYTNTIEEQAQLKFLELVSARGGDACFANGEGTL